MRYDDEYDYYDYNTLADNIEDLDEDLDEYYHNDGVEAWENYYHNLTQDISDD